LTFGHNLPAEKNDIDKKIMSKTSPQITPVQWLQFLLGTILAVSFFLPWVSWDGSLVKGSALAAGHFFSVSETRFGLANPFPGLSFGFYVFWLVPILALASGLLAVLQKKSTPLAFFAGALSLALVTVYILFSNILIDLGVAEKLTNMLKPGLYVHAVAAAGLILTAIPAKNLLPKLGWLILGPVLAFASFKIGESKVMGETHKDTAAVKADYTVAADSLIREFLVNDTAANKKYLEKVLEVNGKAAAVEVQADSTSTIRFADSTGSYAIFTLEKDQLEKVKSLKAGDPVSVKGVCSGSIFSEILGTTSINFKRSTLHKN
jgi:hypothetical protein